MLFIVLSILTIIAFIFVLIRLFFIFIEDCTVSKFYYVNSDTSVENIAFSTYRTFEK